MNTLKRIKIFVKSLWFHVWSGFPKSTKDEILERYQICSNCEFFDKQQNQCLVCGCNISTKKVFLNKLAWADQECPKNKWTKITRNKK